MLGVEDASIEIGFQDEWQRIHSWHMKLALRNRFGTDKTPLRAQWVYD